MTPRQDGGRRQGLSAFGLSLLTDLALPGAWQTEPLPTGPSPEPALRLTRATPEEIRGRWSGLDGVGWEGSIDGAPFAVERGVAGDYRFVHGAHPDESGVPDSSTQAIHHLSADMGLLLCAPSDPDDPSWWRVVLDSVLFTVALLHGYEALHAGAVATPDGGVIAITASMGGGKSTLLSELLHRGLSLMADDVLVLESRGAAASPLAHPAPPLMTIPVERVPLLAGTAPTTETGPSEAGSPEGLCSLEDELWIAVPVHPTPLPLQALVVLDRRPGAQLSLTRIDNPLSPLMDSLMNFPRTTERQRARFELASVLSRTAALWQLTADSGSPPEALADLLQAGDPGCAALIRS